MSNAAQEVSTDATYDVIVMGAGPVGLSVAARYRAGGLSVAVVEKELVGGECSYWACIPVLSAGPTPHTPLDEWTFTIRGAVAEPLSWTWDEFRALPSQTITTDIHCVTKCSKLDTTWAGVALDTLLAGFRTSARYALAFSDGDYTTNLPLADLTGGQALIAYSFNGAPLEPQHGGPARLLVPHLHFWKSAKWVRGLELRDEDTPGFWERYGYHNYGDPWQQQRYAGD